MTKLAVIAGLALLACGGNGYIELICSTAGTGSGCSRTCSLAVDRGITQTLVQGQAVVSPVDEGLHIVSGNTTLSCPTGSTVTQVQESVYVPADATIALTYPH
jgi:hypothetical protein